MSITAILMNSNRPGHCDACHRPFRTGQEIGWVPRGGGVFHSKCCPYPLVERGERTPEARLERLGEKMGEMIAQALAQYGDSPEHRAVIKRGLAKMMPLIRGS